MSNRISSFFKESHLDEVARQTGFVKRRSKFTPSMMLDTLLFNPVISSEQSLNGLCSHLGMQQGLRMARQSLDERFNERGVKFLEELLVRSMVQLRLNESGLSSFSQFNRVLIKDSTAFELPSSMTAPFPGKGGSTSSAAVSIQFEYDLKTIALSRLLATPDSKNDHEESAKTLDDIKAGDLLIRDLGYVSMDYMEQVAERNAYYINRVSPQVVLFQDIEGKAEPLNLDSIRHLLAKGRPYIVVDVLIGSSRKMSCRAVFCAIPEEKMEERAKRQARKTKRRGSKKTDQKIWDRLDLNIFITNTSEELFSAAHIYNAYRLRWQVELVFKAWKSHFKINKLKSCKKERVHMVLLANLIWIVLSWSVIGNLISTLYQKKGELLSVQKIAATLAMQKPYFSQIVSSTRKVQNWLRRLLHLANYALLCEKKRGSLSSYEILDNIA